MKAGINRRYFLKQSALAAGALGATGLLPRRTYAATKGGTKLNCVQIGCGGRGRSHLDAVIVKNAQNLYALVEPDVKQHAAVKKILETKGIDTRAGGAAARAVGKKKRRSAFNRTPEGSLLLKTA